MLPKEKKGKMEELSKIITRDSGEYLIWVVIRSGKNIYNLYGPLKKKSALEYIASEECKDLTDAVAKAIIQLNKLGR